MNFLVNLDNLNDCERIKSEVSEVTIPANLSKAAHLKDIFRFLKKNQLIKTLSICDDYLDPADDDTKYFCGKILQDLPDIKINWIREFKIDGRHGR